MARRETQAGSQGEARQRAQEQREEEQDKAATTSLSVSPAARKKGALNEGTTRLSNSDLRLCCCQPTSSFGKNSQNYVQRESPSATQFFLKGGIWLNSTVRLGTGCQREPRATRTLVRSRGEREDPGPPWAHSHPIWGLRTPEWSHTLYLPTSPHREPVLGLTWPCPRQLGLPRGGSGTRPQSLGSWR